MPLRAILLAGLIGFFVDYFLTTIVLLFGGLLIGVAEASQLQMTNPAHVLVMLILPGLMTLIGGAVAGYLAALEPRPAGALVGGFGFLSALIEGLDPDNPFTKAGIIVQSVATVLAMGTAMLGARRRLKQYRGQK